MLMISKTVAHNPRNETERAKQAIQGLVGKKCWKATFAYGGELHLHFGAHVPYSSPRMAGQTKGAWRLGTCGTPWTLETSGRKVSSRQIEKQLECAIKSIEGCAVRSVKVTVCILSLKFDNGWTLLVTPSAEDEKFEDIPYWELFMPRHMMVTFGSGAVWSFRRSNQ